MRREFHPEALEEYREATLYYTERDPALAVRFIDAVEDAIQRISRLSKLCRKRKIHFV
jgi:plasmid stabilization system protein ParE